MAQLVTRISDALAADVDAAVAAGEAANRSDLVRRAVEELLDRRRREDIVRSTLDAYRRLPQTEEELAGIDRQGKAMIAEEPW